MEARIRVRLTPRASRDEIAGWQEGVLSVRVSATPIDGKANATLERLLAQALGVPRAAVGIVSGHRGRDKDVVIDGLGQDEAVERLQRASN